MYSGTSDTYNAAVQTTGRRFCARMSLGGKNINAQIMSYTLGRYSGDGEDYTLGQAYASNVTISCITDTDLKNKEINLETGLYLGDTPEYVPEGYYTVLSLKEKGGIKTLTAYDRMYVYGAITYTCSEFPMTLGNMATEVAQQMGTEFDVNCLTTADANLQVPVMPQGYTLQVTAGYLAGLIGGNAYIDRNGKLTFRIYKNSGYAFDAGQIADIDMDTTARTITQIRCTTDIDGGTVLQAGPGPGYATMVNPLMSQAILNQAAEKISGTSYYAAEIPMILGDNRLDPWDIINYSDAGKNIIPHEMQISYDGGLQCNLISYALAESEQNGYRGPLQQMVENIRKQTQESARSASIVSDTYVFKYNSDGSIMGVDTANLTAQLQHVTVDRWQYRNTDSNWTDYPDTSDNTTITGTGLVVKSTHDIFQGDTAQIRLLTSDASVYDTTTLTKIYDGKQGDDGDSTLTVVLGNEAQTIACDSDGKTLEDTTIEIPYTGYSGTRQIACRCTVGQNNSVAGMTLQTNRDATDTLNGLIVLIVAAGGTLTGQNGTVKLNFSIADQSIQKTFTWSKSIAGQNGQDGEKGDKGDPGDPGDPAAAYNLIPGTKKFDVGNYINWGPTAGKWVHSTGTDDFGIWTLTTDSSQPYMDFVTTLDATEKAQADVKAVFAFDIKCSQLDALKSKIGAGYSLYRNTTADPDNYTTMVSYTTAYMQYASYWNTADYVDGEWCRVRLLANIPSFASMNIDSRYQYRYGVRLRVASGVTNGLSIQIRRPKMELGTVMTEWMPHVDDAADDAAEIIDSRMTALEIFNRLTENGNLQGLYKDPDTGEIYINAAYIAAGILASKGQESWISLEDGTFSFADGKLTYTTADGLKIIGDITTVGELRISNAAGTNTVTASIGAGRVELNGHFTATGGGSLDATVIPNAKWLYFDADNFLKVERILVEDTIYTQNLIALTKLSSAEAVFHELTVGDITVDKSWTALTLAPGFTQGSYGRTTLAYRRIGNHVYIAGSVKKTAAFSGNTVVAKLPTAIVPAKNMYRMAACMGARIARIIAHSDGNLRIEWVKDLSTGNDNTTTTGIWVDMTIDYWLD